VGGGGRRRGGPYSAFNRRRGMFVSGVDGSPQPKLIECGLPSPIPVGYRYHQIQLSYQLISRQTMEKSSYSMILIRSMPCVSGVFRSWQSGTLWVNE